VAIIMDGNGRWARGRGLPRIAGHRAGANAVRRTVEAAPRAGVTTLTLYAFSADNWRRPPSEVSALMELLRSYLRREVDECVQKGVRVNVIGRRDRLAREIVSEIEHVEALTAGGTNLQLRMAIDYSAKQAITTAAQLAGAAGADTPEAFAQLLNEAIHSNPPAPDVDLLIRTSGEQRLSDFMLWECAYAELYFTDRLWPDFASADLEAALAAFRARERRFGGLLERAGA
jgi:undecaprenyl diphosphate synthase